MTTIPVMPLFPIRGNKYTPDEYVEDLIDGDLGLGAWRKGQDDNEYNIKIEYDRLTLDEKRILLDKLEANPNALQRFHQLEEQFNQYYDYYSSDSRDIGTFLTGCVRMMESAVKKAEEDQTLRSENNFEYPDRPARPNEICASLVPFVYPEFAAHCEKSLAVYARLPLELHMSVYTDEEQTIPATADVCGQSAFDAIYNSGRFDNTQFSKTLAAYQSCEYTILDREQVNRDYEVLTQDLVARLSAMKIKVTAADLPRESLMRAVGDGWHGGLISKIRADGSLCSLTFYDPTSGDRLIVGFSFREVDSDAVRSANSVQDFNPWWSGLGYQGYPLLD